MSLVPYFKFALLNYQKPPVYANKAVNGVEMDNETFMVLKTIQADYNAHRLELFKQFPEDYLKAQVELYHEIATEGRLPTINPLEFKNNNEIMKWVEEDLEHFEEDEEKEEEPVAPANKAKTRPIGKKKVPTPVSVDTAVETTATAPKKRAGRKKKIATNTPTEGEGEGEGGNEAAD